MCVLQDALHPSSCPQAHYGITQDALTLEIHFHTSSSVVYIHPILQEENNLLHATPSPTALPFTLAQRTHAKQAR